MITNNKSLLLHNFYLILKESDDGSAAIVHGGIDTNNIVIAIHAEETSKVFYVVTIFGDLDE